MEGFKDQISFKYVRVRVEWVERLLNKKFKIQIHRFVL